mgnify:CR=1 FL=1
MQLKYDVHTIHGDLIIVLKEKGVIINNAQEFLDVIIHIPSDRIILNKENIHEDFFNLRSGLAGEILQKAVNYSRRVGIVGDFSIYESKSLKDFIYESNKSNKIVFVSTVEEGLKRLSIKSSITF